MDELNHFQNGSSSFKACPFCGSSNIIIKDSENGVDEKVWCLGCQANIPRFKGRRKELIGLWNLRTQPENKPISLEELRKMDNQPVWIVDSEIGGNQWYIKGFSEWFADGYDNCYDEYGKTWLAYVHKPDES